MKKMKRYFSGALLFALLCIFSVCVYAHNDNDLVINADSTYNGITVDGDLYVIKDRILTLTGNCTVNGNVYVYGTLRGSGNLTCKGTLNCLYYKLGSITMSAGSQYNFGVVSLTGRVNANVLNVRDNYLPDDLKLPDPDAPTPPAQHVHTWTKTWLDKQSCTSGWVQNYICYECGETKSEPVTPEGHIFYNNWYTTEPSCDSAGERYRFCSVCGYKESIAIPATGHDWGQWYVDEPDCVDEGEKDRFCRTCGEMEAIKIPATGVHEWSEWITDEEPGCITGNGLRYRECLVCDERQTEVVKPYGAHLFGKWEIYQEPCCIFGGIACRACIRCGEVEDKELPIDKNAHYCKKWKVLKKATALSTGRKTGRCLDCGKKVTVKIPKLKAKVSLNKKTLTIKKKKAATLKVKSKTYGDKISSWKSSNKKIATVNSKGKVTANGMGKAVITLRMKSGAIATCTITVK